MLLSLALSRYRFKSGVSLCCLCIVLLVPLLRGAELRAQVRSPYTWLPTNFDTTVNGNYRGARITSFAQLDSMRRVYGIGTIINLAKDALPKSGPGRSNGRRNSASTTCRCISVTRRLPNSIGRRFASCCRAVACTSIARTGRIARAPSSRSTVSRWRASNPARRIVKRGASALNHG